MKQTGTKLEEALSGTVVSLHSGSTSRCTSKGLAPSVALQQSNALAYQRRLRQLFLGLPAIAGILRIKICPQRQVPVRADHSLSMRRRRDMLQVPSPRKD
jgi:hypothetical protein